MTAAVAQPVRSRTGRRVAVGVIAVAVIGFVVWAKHAIDGLSIGDPGHQPDHPVGVVVHALHHAVRAA